MPTEKQKEFLKNRAAKWATDKTDKKTSKKVDKKSDKKEEKVKESTDRTHISEFVLSICNKDFSTANQKLQAIVNEKVKNRIKGSKKVDKKDSDEKSKKSKVGAEIYD